MIGLHVQLLNIQCLTAMQLLRVLDSLQLSANYPVATPADWQPGDEVMIAPRVSNEEADKLVSSSAAAGSRKGACAQKPGSRLGRAELPVCSVLRIL